MVTHLKSSQCSKFQLFGNQIYSKSFQKFYNKLLSNTHTQAFAHNVITKNIGTINILFAIIITARIWVAALIARWLSTLQRWNGRHQERRGISQYLARRCICGIQYWWPLVVFCQLVKEVITWKWQKSPFVYYC